MDSFWQNAWKTKKWVLLVRNFYSSDCAPIRLQRYLDVFKNSLYMILFILTILEILQEVSDEILYNIQNFMQN